MNCVYLIIFLAFQLDFIPKFGAAKNEMRLEEEERVIGGTLVKPKQFPWVVSIVKSKPNATSGLLAREYDKRCGGSVINELYVLTAAHCFYHYKKDTKIVEYLFDVKDFRVVSGLLDLSRAKDSDLRRVEKRIIHRQFNPLTFLNDITLLRLAKKLTFNDFVKPITISYDWIGDGQVATVAGWGNTCNDNEDQFQLRYVTLTTVASGKCLGDGSVPGKVSDNNDTRTFICAGPDTRTGGGDSGGGLWMSKGRDNSLIGIVSHGVTCNSTVIKEVPSSFVRISHYQNWINKNSKI